MFWSKRSMNTSAKLAALGFLTVASVAVAQPPRAEPLSVTRQSSSPWEDWIDTEQIRRQFLGDMTDWHSGHGLGSPWSPQPASVIVPLSTLGIATIALPDYLRIPELSQSAHCGQLITHVSPTSVAHHVGLKVGMTIIEIDGHPLSSTADLSQLVGWHALVVLTDEGPRRIEVDLDFDTAMAIDAFAANQLPAVTPRAVARSLSISEANGVLAVAAIVDTDQGPERVELKGSRTQVELQLRELSPCIQAALRPHLR